MKPKVVIMYDSPGWSFHHIALQLQAHLSDEYDITTCAHHEPDKPALLEADAVICLWYGSICYLHQGTDYFAFWQDRIIRPDCKMIACCFDEILRWDRNAGWANEETILFAIQHSDAFLCSSDGMALRMFPYFPQPKHLGRCQDGVDLDLFPAHSYRSIPLKPDGPTKDLFDTSTPLRVGWVGSTETFSELKGVDMIQQVCADLDGVQFVHQNKHEHGIIPHEDMHQFYGMIDVQVCMSTCEGTPNPILEASACGRAWVSTDVGIVPEMMADAREMGCAAPPGIIIPRQESALYECLRKLTTNRQMLPIMGKVGRYVVERRWQWKDRAEQYRDALHAVGLWGDADFMTAVHRPPKDTAKPPDQQKQEIHECQCSPRKVTVTIHPEDPLDGVGSALNLLKSSNVRFTMRVIVSKDNFGKIPQYMEIAQAHDCDCFLQEVLPNDLDTQAFLKRALLSDHVENNLWIKAYQNMPGAEHVKVWPTLMRRVDIEMSMGVQS